MSSAKGEFIVPGDDRIPKAQDAPLPTYHNGCWEKYYAGISEMVRKDIKKEIKAKSRKCEQCDDWVVRFREATTSLLIRLCLTATIMSVVSGGLFCLWKVITAGNQVRGCYTEIESSNNLYYVYGRRHWRSDLLIGRYANLDDAILASNKLNCPIANSVESP